MIREAHLNRDNEEIYNTYDFLKSVWDGSDEIDKQELFETHSQAKPIYKISLASRKVNAFFKEEM